MNELVLDSISASAPPWPCSSFDDGVADLLTFLRVQPLEHRPQATEQRVQVQRGLRVVFGRSWRPAAACAIRRARGDFQIPVTDQVQYRIAARVEVYSV